MIGALARLVSNLIPQLTTPIVEGPFDFVVSTVAYSEPAGEGPFDFKVEV